MKLAELDPRWCGGVYRDPSTNSQWSSIWPSGEPRRGMGLSFDCPVHRAHRLAVMFSNPIDGGPATEYTESMKHLWQRTGETFDTLTLGPSIDASGCSYGDAVKTPCWHGYIANGEIS